MDYADFTIRARDWQDGRFKVEVTNSPVDRMREPEVVTCDEAALERPLRNLARKRIRLHDLIALGESLADLLLPPTVRQMLLRSLEAVGSEQGLRLRLVLDDPQVANLPWEYAYLHRAAGEKGHGGFLVLDRRISMVRHEAIPIAPGSVKANLPLKLVAGLSSPSDAIPLDLEAERGAIEKALADVEDVEVTFIEDLTVEKLALACRGAHIFHFAGHGRFAWQEGDAEGRGAIVLEDETGHGHHFPAENLALTLHGAGVRLAVLGACDTGGRDGVNVWSGVAPALMRAGIPAVVAMQYEIYDDSSIAFGRGFYQALAAGLSLDEAVSAGRLAVLHLGGRDDVDWGTPVLYMRASDGYIFEIEPVSDRPAPPIPAPATAPSPPVHFTGRHDELDVLARTLTSGDITQSIIALQGMGGVGKTAAALKLADELSPQFPGGVFWGPLPAYDGNPRAVLRKWAKICGHDLSAETDPDAMADLVRDLLAAREVDRGPLLTVIDDIRPEWLDAAQLLRQAIPAGTPLLVTTRDETLAVVLGAHIHRLDILPTDESLALLKAHAGSAVVEADPQEAEALLQAIGCLPLAIELAGKHLALRARKPGYRLATLRQAVEKRAAQVLTLPGHRGLAAAFAVTYEALSPEAQRLFRWLGAFAPGPLKVAAVAKVMGWYETEAESCLDELVLLALLDWGESQGIYTIHPLLGQYAQTLLVETPDAEEAEKRHLAYYLAFAQANAQAEPSAWDRLEEELPNLLLVAKRAAKIKDVAAMVSFEEALLHESKFLYIRGYYQETVDLLCQSLGVQKSVSEPRDQPRTLNKLAFFCMRLGRHQEAQKHAEAAHSLAIVLKDREQQSDSSYYLGIIFHEQGQHNRALAHFEKQLELRRELGNPSLLANALNSVGMAHIALGGYVEAKRHFDEALTIYDKAGDLEGVVLCIGNRGIPSLFMGDYANALNDFETALSQSKALGDRYGMALNLHNQGTVQSFIGDYALALQSLEEALPFWQELGDKSGEALTLCKLAEIYGELGDCRRAVEYLQVADMQIRETGDREVAVDYLNTLGAVRYEQGDYEGALTAYLQMEALATETGLTNFLLVQNKLGLSRTHLAQGGGVDLEKAQRRAVEAINLCRESGQACNEPRGHAYLGKVNLLLGHKEVALQNCREAMRLLDEQKHVPGSEAELYLITIQVLAVNGLEANRRQHLEQAYDLVQATAAKIEDEALRQSYLAVPINREIVETWARERAGRTAWRKRKPRG